jgi:hypothetical protein
MWLQLVAAAVVIPLGLDLYMPVPEDNPLTAVKIELGRRLFFAARLSRSLCPALPAIAPTARSPTGARWPWACSAG